MSNKFLHKAAYHATLSVLHGIALLPFRALYILSDGITIVLYHVIRYRRKIVKSNLLSAFPEKDPNEIKNIEKQFYHWFTDCFLETVKLLRLTPKELSKHITFINTEEVEAFMQKGVQTAAILGHHCNWEWLSAITTALPQSRTVGLIYKPIRNTAIDQTYIKIRQKNGGVTIPKNLIIREISKYYSQKRMCLIGYIADQAPKIQHTHLHLDFMHRLTPVFTGAERIMRKYQNAVFYVDMFREKRGKYTCHMRLITPNAAETKEHEITRKFFELLTQSITRQPHCYLWSHNRWKNTPPQNTIEA